MKPGERPVAGQLDQPRRGRCAPRSRRTRPPCAGRSRGSRAGSRGRRRRARRARASDRRGRCPRPRVRRTPRRAPLGGAPPVLRVLLRPARSAASRAGSRASRVARTAPSGETAIALTPVVPTSRPTRVRSAAMELRELRPGLWRWTTAPSGVEAGRRLGAPTRRRDDLVLIDPLLGADDALDSRSWRASTSPSPVLVTIFWHTRSADVVAARHDARVLAPSGGKAAVRRRALDDGGVPAGRSAPGRRRGARDGAQLRGRLLDPGAPRASCPGTCSSARDGGGVRLCPRSWLPESTSLERLRTLAPPAARAAGHAGPRLARRAGPAERPRGARARRARAAAVTHWAPSAA